MSLDVALVIRGDSAGAKKALDDTASGVEDLGRKAERASKPVKAVAEGLDETGRSAAGAKEQVVAIGTVADATGGKLTQFSSLALGAVGGFAAGLATSGIATLFGAAGEAALGLANAILDNSANVEADLKSHKSLVDQIKGAYAEATGAASQYGNASGAFLTFQTQQNTIRLKEEYDLLQKGLFDRGANFGANPLAPGAVSVDSPFAASITKFRADLQAGTADVIAFKNEIAAISASLPNDDANRSVAEAIFGNVEQAAEVQQNLMQSTDLLKGLQGNAEAAAAALGGSADKFGALGKAADAINPSLVAADTVLKSIAANANAIPASGFDEIGLGPRFMPNGTQTMGFALGGTTSDRPQSTRVERIIFE